MKSSLITGIAVLLIVLAAGRGRAELTLGEGLEPLFMQGIVYAYENNMDAALAAFDSLERMSPKSPVGAFSKAFTYDLFMDEYRSLAFMNEFNEVVERAISLAEAQKKSGEETAEMHLFLGGVYGIRGVRKAMIGDWWGAFKDARQGIKGVEKAAEMDPTLYDAYYGIGNYHYWKSARLKSFTWIPFIDDEREKGIKELYLTIEKGKFAPRSAKTALIRIYVEEKRWEDCVNTADELISVFEPDLHPRWGKAYALIKLGRYGEALSVYDEIYDLMIERPFYGKAGLAEIWYYQAFAHYSLQHFDEAADLLEKVFPLKKDVNDRVFFFENVFEEAEKLRLEIAEKRRTAGQ